MIQDIFAGVLCVIVLATGIWGWWLENGKTSGSKDTNKDVAEDERI